MPPAIATRLEELLRDVAAQLHPDDGDFVGRQFVRDVIRQRIAERNRMLVLIGPPGVGKTALAAALVREQCGAEQPYLAHFCSLSGGDNPFSFCGALAQQLYDQLGSDYTLPQTARAQQVTLQASVNVGQTSGEAHITALQLNIGGMHPREAFRQLVCEPLRAYDAAHGAERGNVPLVIVIEALDRAWDWDGGQGGNIVSVLADVQDLPAWVTLICTARSGPAVQALRAHAGVQVFEIDPHSNENLDDVACFFRDRFLGALGADERARFDALLAASSFGGAGSAEEHSAAFVRSAVSASQGNFLFVRRYVDAWRSALLPDADQLTVDPAALLRFDVGGSLADTLDTTYATISTQIRSALTTGANSADEDVLAALAIAFAPLSLQLLARITKRPIDAIADSLGRLAPVVEQDSTGADVTYALYHRGFADYMRQQLPLGGRAWDVRAAQALEQTDGGNPLVRDYSARYRWSHLLRGLDLAEAVRTTAAPQQGDAAPSAAVPPDWLDGIAQVQAQVRDAVTQAQLLRELAARALDPVQSDAVGSWSAALSCLKAAEKALWRSRALVGLRERGGRLDSRVSVAPELIEQERTLIALGDAYGAIARRMDAGGQRPSRPVGLVGWLNLFWDALARFPLTIYLLLVLIFQGVREIHIPGALQNLGRAQDWTVARLCVLSVSAYRRARQLAHARGADDIADDVAERLAGLYKQMGAYDAAASTYGSLLAQPTTIERPWRQAVWRLALGEVLLAQRKADHAVELLTSALPTFVALQAPVQQARALTALASAHHLQAMAAEARGDVYLSATVEDLIVANCREALAAWGNVTTLQGDESISVDPALAVSMIAHQLWRASRDPHLGDEQQRAARELLDTIPERHYPQRFEHPLLRLFRLTALVLLPAYVLAGLLLAVQRPNTVQVRVRTVLAFQPPLLNLEDFPNDLIAGKTTSPAAFSAGQLLQLAANGDRLKFQPNAPSLDPLAISWVVLLFVALYLVCYTVFGLLVITLSSPAQFQNRRPGRLILRKDSLSWRGPTGQGSLLDAWEWIWHDISALWISLRRRMMRALGFTPPPPVAEPAPVVATLPLSDVAELIPVDRRALGYLLYDFSCTLVQPRDKKRRPVSIPGTLMNYDELCDELDRLLGVPRRPFGVDIVRSASGVCFLLTLLYALILVALLPLAPGALHTSLPGVEYSLSNLYVLVTPGLLLPLLWWFVAQPLGASSARAWTEVPLTLTALAGVALTFVVLDGLFSLTSFGLKPDLATPVLACGLLMALVCYAPPRPLRRVFAPNRSHLLRIGLAFLGLMGLGLLLRDIGTTVLWYDALVRGNRLVEQALAQSCPGDDGCTVPAAAIAYYDRVICLRPGDSDGYAFRGFAYLARQKYEPARADFEAALRVGQADGPQPSPGCAPSAPSALTDAQRASLYADVGAVDTLLARHMTTLPEAETHYRSALCSYARALDMPAAADCGSGAVTLASQHTDALNCSSMMSDLLGSNTGGGIGKSLDLLTPGALTVAAGRAPFVLQLADACYSSGFARSQALTKIAEQDREATRQNAWGDLVAATAGYTAVTNARTSAQDHDLANHGLAAAWLALSQLDPPASTIANMPVYDRRTALLRALITYQALGRAGPPDINIYTGQAWSAIQLGAWNDASAPLARAGAMAPDDPIYPALQGLAAWLDSTQYPVPRKGAPSPRYAAAIKNAIDFYTQVIALDKVHLGRAYATRSLLYFSLRNTPRGDTYADEDYAAWMRLALADVDQALIAADHLGQPPTEQVGYRYWRGRLSFALAVTLQEKFRGPYEWSQLVPLYSRAFDDFTAATAIDPNPDRRKIYRETWVPWSRIVLINATHMQLAQLSARRGNFAQARAELALVDPRPSSVRQWEQDTLSAPLPDYWFLQGLISLGLATDAHTPRQLVVDESADAPGAAEASYAQAIAQTENPNIVAQPSTAYRTALADLDALLKAPPNGWPASARATAERVHARLQERLQAVTKG